MKKYIIMLVAMLTIVTMMCINCYAYPSSYPSVSLDNNCDNYIITTIPGVYGAYQVVKYNTDDWTPVVDGSSVTWIKNRDTAYVRYYAQCSENQFNIKGWGTYWQYDKMSEGGEVTFATETIYDTTGKVVFLVPPPLKEKVEGALKNFQMKVGGMTNTLVLCGVGCLACLMALSLFGKRSQLFHL